MHEADHRRPKRPGEDESATFGLSAGSLCVAFPEDPFMQLGG